jgi:PAS domain S-box-containing protein
LDDGSPSTLSANADILISMGIGQERKELSPRETLILQLAMEGQTDAAIARRLGIAEPTVATYWGRIRVKYGPLSRTEIVATYLRERSESELGALKVENAQLLKEILASARRAAQSEDDEFLQLFRAAPDAILILLENGTIENLNPAAEDLFGWSSKELEGKNLTTLIPQRLRDAHIEHRKAYFSNPTRRTMGEHLATPALHKDGSEFLIAATLSATSFANEMKVVCFVRRVGN